MRQEAKDLLLQVAVGAPTSLYALVSRITLAEWIALALGLLQALYLLRKWWREETEWGQRMRRWARRPAAATAPVELDE